MPWRMFPLFLFPGRTRVGWYLLPLCTVHFSGHSHPHAFILKHPTCLSPDRPCKVPASYYISLKVFLWCAVFSIKSKRGKHYPPVIQHSQYTKIKKKKEKIGEVGLVTELPKSYSLYILLIYTYTHTSHGQRRLVGYSYRAAKSCTWLSN